MPTVVRCPTCDTEVPWNGNSYRPFCSERCRLIDLGAWVEGKYRISGPELEDESERVDGNTDEETD